VKTLFIIRHAKSSWDASNIDDFERPLNDRGKRDAPRMGKRFKEKDIHPSLLLSSPAKACIVHRKEDRQRIEISKDDIKTTRRLYHADEETMLTVVRELKESQTL
jgi:phosphohistidine phosphatase